ncbi:MAG TPA: DNA polymerase III subunit delta, partial [Cryomorphaceae bacterium]|nr:DNA polymerase III subunit delta [Cryomorphaceae bacterium]
MAVTLDVLQREWQAKTFRPVYVFAGDEPFFMDQAMEALATQTLEKHERDFNLTVLYGDRK